MVERANETCALDVGTVVSGGGTVTIMHNIKLLTEDGETFEFDCAEGEDVLSAGLRNNVILMSECRKGVCTTCRVLCAEGEFDLGKGVNVYSLPPEDQEEGYTLLCQTFPRSDLVVELPYGSDRVTFGSADFERTFPMIIAGVTRWTKHVMSLELRFADGSVTDFAFRPGQYVNLRVPGTDKWRSFSMANGPDFKTENGPRVELMIRLLEDGEFSKYLCGQAKVGDTIDMRGPFGNFTVRNSDGRRRCFVAGSTGLAPLVSMLRELAKKGDTTPATLIFGMRSKEYLFYEEELKALAHSLPALDLRLTLESGHDGWSGRCGSVADVFADVMREARSDAEVYICGPAGMVGSVEGIARTYKVPSGRIFTEPFQASG